MKTTSSFSRLALGSLVATLLLGCPQVPSADPLELAPSITSFTASQYEVPVGTSIKLSWATENATQVKIDELKLGSISGVEGSSGEVEVAITGDSFFVLTTRNARGASQSAVISIRVGAAAGDLLFTGVPDLISAGQSATLAWSAPGAATVTITANPGGPIDLGGQGAVGTITVTPASSTVYTLTSGVRSVSTTVNVRPTLISFTSSTLSADAGSTVTLSWATANATRVQLSAPGRGNLVDEMTAARVASGTFDDVLPAQVDPDQLFTYQLTVIGPGPTLTDSIVVSIKGNPAVVSFDAPKYIAQVNDGGITLSWATREADSVELTAAGVLIYRAPQTAVAAGSLHLPAPTTDTTFVLTAGNARGGAATRTALVDVVGPPTVALTATPSTIAPGEPLVLSWAGTDVRNVRISSPSNGTLFTATDTTDTGVAPATTFLRSEVVRIDVDNGVGQTSFATANITLTGGLQFSLPTGSTRAGERVNVSWTPANIELTGLAHDDVVTRTGSTGFDDIATSGAALSFSGADNATKFQTTGFSAPFYDRVVGSNVWVDADGYLSFSQVGDRNWNSTALPTSKIEAYSIAPCWADQSPTAAYWQVKTVTGGKVLIVQWDAKYQVKVFTSGQIDIEYKAPGTCTNRGVRGPRGDMGFAFATTPAANVGLTIFGPKTGSATVPLQHELPLLATTVLNGTRLTASFDPGQVIRPNELSFSEVLAVPALAVGPAGQWFELFNARSTPIDLTGWSLGVTDGGTSAPLSGTIPSRGVLVLGSSLDPALNDDAGVQLALTGFTTGVDAGAVVLGRNGALSTFSWANASPGLSTITDFGPYRFSTDTSSSLNRPQTCVPTTTFGAQVPAQGGNPGVAQGCGFPYLWQEIPGGFFDISTTGTMGVISDPTYDEATFSLPLAAAPFPYFGVPQTSANVSTNGFISFDGTSRNSTLGSNFPSTTDVNSVVAPFGGDLVGYWLDSEIYTQRIGPNVDPAAAAAHWIIQWKHWSHYGTYSDISSGDDLNFQIKLFDDGVIEYHYGRMVSVSSTRSASGIRTVTWLENPTGTQALVINTRSFVPGISPDSGFRFVPR